MGHSQSQDAINNMSTVLLTITCSIRGVFKCLDCGHNLFFDTIYCQNTRSTWECSDRCQCQAELAAWLSEFIFCSWYHFIDRSLAGMANSLSDWRSIPGGNSVKYSKWPAYDVQDMVSVDFFQRYTCKLVCVGIAAKLLLHVMKSARSCVSFLWLNVLPAQTENTLPRLDEMRIAIQLHF